MRSQGENVGTAYLEEARLGLASCLDQLRHCLGQLDDGQVWWRPREGMNSIADLLLHLCGNVAQRVGSVVGGRLDAFRPGDWLLQCRDRDREFAERGPIPKADLVRRLEDEVGEADAVLAGLGTPELLGVRRYQGLGRELEGTVLAVVFRTLLHVSGLTQEVVHLTRLQLGDAYRFRLPAPPTGPGGPLAGAPEQVIADVTDAVFERGPVVPPDEGEAAGDGPGEAGPTPGSPVGDYVRDIQQEFEEEEDEGKL
jgi:Protein of unknown function (DUF1572)